ncbi:MAG: plasmid pRiA4b ORF-3 family protein [Rhodocyclaceae bacterium]|nr:plasmid pRiA4b ORF-3 family protein [Rhodocyclaceae bacterium]MBX3668334.1 plasmid pRiA4b ORF-3 family protein [Rhodocyclaceae bacterium]
MSKTAAKVEPPQAAPMLQLKVELAGAPLPIWRRLLVPANIKLADLHVVIQMVMGWQDDHQHIFEIDGRLYGKSGHHDDEQLPERKYTLADALGAKRSFRYIYDFGDDWEHRIKLEKRVPPQAQTARVQCLEGSGTCPPEDIGGVWGYGDFLDALDDPEHDRHEEFLDWADENFDPAVFDLAEANKHLAKLKF